MSQNTKSKPLIDEETISTSTTNPFGDNVFDEQSDSYSANYFDAIYSDNLDPWQYQTRWYEKRKRDIGLAILPQASYINGIELGCGNGIFSEQLAQRCHSLLSIDGNNQAVDLAKQHLVALANVKVIQGIIPEILFTLKTSTLNSNNLKSNFPSNNSPFDLIVISEILYYLSLADIDKVIAWVEQNLALGGTLLCCHWRYAIDGFDLTGETVHERLNQTLNKNLALTHQSQIIDSDFLLEVWQHSTETLARQENLI